MIVSVSDQFPFLGNWLISRIFILKNYKIPRFRWSSLLYGGVIVEKYFSALRAYWGAQNILAN